MLIIHYCVLWWGDSVEFFLPFCLNTVFLWCLFYSLFAMRSLTHFRFMPLFEKCVFYFLRKEQGQRLMPKTSLKNSFKSPLCSCEHCSANKWGRDLLPQCQTHLVSVLPALPYVHMEKHVPKNFVAGFTAASPIMILLYLITSCCC